MKKKNKIIISIVVIFLGCVAVIGYQVYRIVAGSEKLSGRMEKIPAPKKISVPMTKGIADWPQWRGIGADGKNATVGIKTDWSKGLPKLWQVDYLCQNQNTATWSAPVAQGNRLIVLGRDKENDLVFCLHTEDGALLWSDSYRAAAADGHGPGSRATPFIDDTRVYTFGRSGDLVCRQLEDGKMLWRKNVKEVGAQEPQWGCSTSPLVFENKVIVQGGGKALVIAYDKMTGDILWKSLEGNAGYSASVLLTVENEKRLLIYHANALSCLDPSDGKELWKIDWETDYGVNATTPAVENDIVFHTSGYGMGGQAIKVRKDSYSIVWKSKAMASQHSDPVIINGFIYGYSGDSSQNRGDFKCLELSSGKEMWSTNQIGWGTTVYVDGYLICQDIKGNLFLIKPEPTRFQKVGEMRAAIEDVRYPDWTTPIVANGKLYLRYFQRLICYNLMP